MPETRVVGAAVETTDADEIDAIAKRDGLTRSDVIRQVIKIGLPARKAWTPPPVELPKPTTV